MALPVASDNPFPSILITEGTEPAAPAAGKQRLYIDSTTHKLKRTDSSGTDVTIEGTTTTVATDTIWDAAGDIAVGSGADTAAKLAIGAVGGSVGRVNGVVAWNAGTSFPASKATGDRFWRSDLGQGALWDGTRWLSDHQYCAPMPVVGGTVPISATANGFHRMGLPYAGVFDIYVEAVITSFYVVGGTALSGSHKWVGNIGDNASMATLAVSHSIDSGASDTWRKLSSSPNVVVANTLFEIEANWTKTGTPGTLYPQVNVYYRLVMT